MDSRDDTRVPPSGSQFYEASFIQSASSPSSRLMVRVDAFGDAPFGDPDGVVWSPLGNALPAAGDRCLVAESDDGSWWVLAWWSAAQKGTDPLRTVRGIVSSAGAIVEGSGFTPSKTGTGLYTITFTPAFSDVPSVPAPGVVTPGHVARIQAASAASVDILTFNSSTLTGFDSQFHFIATGPV